MRDLQYLEGRDIMKQCYCGNQELTEYSPGYYRCGVCHTLVSRHGFSPDVSKVLSEEKDLYGSHYWEKTMVQEAGVQSIDALIDLYLSERAAYWLKYCLRYLSLGGKAAEVGCGLGQLSYLLKAAGFRMDSFELSPQVCHLIGQRLGLHTICGELCSSQQTYQAILAMDVFEHLVDPEKFLHDCGERLEPGGILILQTPCYNPAYTYEEMLEKQPRFAHLLVEDQHVFLFSRESIAALLKRHGFTSILFEPAYFGDDYDMFLFASKEPLCRNTEEEIEGYLNRIPNGRIIKALLQLAEQKNEETNQRKAVDVQRSLALRDVDILNQLVREKETQIAQYRKAAEERLENIDQLTYENTVLQREAEQRLADVQRLAQENGLLQREAQKRLEDVQRLLEENKLLQREADKRLADVETLTKEIDRLAMIKRMKK